MPNLPKTSRPLPDGRRPARRRSTAERGYGANWQRIRAAKLASHPMCELRFGPCTGWGSQVHHRDHDTTNNSPENLMSVCRACHQQYHARGR